MTSRARTTANLPNTGATITGTQTLTNKTLTAPTINNATIASPTITAPAASLSINTQADSYTMVLSDLGKMIFMNKATASTLTIPDDTTANFPVGSLVYVAASNTGQVTFAGAAGVVVVGTPGLKTRARYSVVTLLKTVPNGWLISGDLTP